MKSFDGFCVRSYYRGDSAELEFALFGESVQAGDLSMVSGCHSLANAIAKANERIQCGFDCEIWTCDAYLNERDMLMSKDDCNNL